ncbi:hemolysin [Leifsonia xyli subsp. cynodontis DSM 46306]|uniref:Uncharacterized protein n=1 Tax=Leifsonia xyli subsp. cynodontis DSM 46306 TaxID=1389489 RepID=U3P656_LEIXC|nr:hemolysin [Leifsonia xyli subsp. cynodontis DSM 46306]
MSSGIRLFGGSQVAASPAPFARLAAPSTATRLSGSLAKRRRCSWLRDCAPVCHASSRATTWSIWTSAEVSFPRANAMRSPVYGSSRVPETTVQAPLRVRAVRSRARMSSRVSQPLPFTSCQARPK